MFAQRNFLACIAGQLKERAYGPKRMAEITREFEGLTEHYRAQGYGDQISQGMAMHRVFENIAFETRERAKRAQKAVEVLAASEARLDQAADITILPGIDPGKGAGAKLARAVMSFMESDPRIGGENFLSTRAAYRGRYFHMLADGLEKYGKGAFGRQRGSAGLGNIVDEIYGKTTGDESAKAFAKAYLETQRVMVDDMNKAGGSLRYLDDYGLPQRHNPASVAKLGEQHFVDTAMDRWNWDRMRWPDGKPIEGDIQTRAEIAKQIFRVQASDGTIKIDPKSFGGRGHAMGNALEEHRFIHYKDADAWRAMHEDYGDGNVMDVIIQHIEGSAHRNAMTQMFGSNPQVWFDNMRAQAMKRAGDIAAQPKTAADRVAVDQVVRVLDNRAKPMWETLTRQNPLSVNSNFASGVLSAANLITAAKLGSVPLLAVMGDFTQTLAIRLGNRMPLLDGISAYMKGVSTNFSEMQGVMARSGFVFDNHVGANYSTDRFALISEYGPAWSRNIADATIRTSGLARHTEVARATSQQEFMGLLGESVKTKFDDLPFRHVLARYGIDAGEWDALRKNVNLYNPAKNAEWLRPVDIMQSNIANKDELYRRVYTMIHQESLYMVPGATLEAQSMLRLGTRPNTVPGAILHSFSMYKNFPLTFTNMYGRFALAQEHTSGRLKFAAAIAAASIVTGAMGVQLREASRGREPLPMDTANFWGRAVLSGGGLGVMGDFLFTDVNERGRGIQDVIAGPLWGVLSDTRDLAIGAPFKYVDAWDKSEEMKSDFAARAVDFMRWNAPGTSLWWARLALEREVWDKLELMADPNGYRKQRARVRRQEREYGNTYFAPPGQSLFGD